MNEVEICDKCGCKYYRHNYRGKMCWNCQLKRKDGRTIEVKL